MDNPPSLPEPQGQHAWKKTLMPRKKCPLTWHGAVADHAFPSVSMTTEMPCLAHGSTPDHGLVTLALIPGARWRQQVRAANT